MRINNLVKSVVTTALLFLAIPAFAQVQSAAPQTWWYETDQTLPNGMWHIQVSNDRFVIEKNTAANGAFGTALTMMAITGGTVSFPSAATFSGQVGAGHGRTDAQLEWSNSGGGHGLVNCRNMDATEECALTTTGILSNGSEVELAANFTRFVNSVNTFNNYKTVWCIHQPDSVGDKVPICTFSNNSAYILAGNTSNLPWTTAPNQNTLQVGNAARTVDTKIYGGIFDYQGTGQNLVLAGLGAGLGTAIASTNDSNTGLLPINIQGSTLSFTGGNASFDSNLLAATLQASNLTSGRVPVTSTSGLLTDDSDMTFATDTLTVTKIRGSTSVSTPSLITASGALTVTPAAGSNLNVALSTTGDFAVNTNQLYVDTSTARVGINTTAPLGALDVINSQNATSHFYFQNQDATNTNSRASLDVISGDATLSMLAISGNNTFLIGTLGRSMNFLQSPGGTVNMTIGSTGGVIVGAASGGDLGAGTINAAGGISGTALSVAQGSLTAASQGITGTATWNSSTVGFTLNKYTVTDTASLSTSKMFEYFGGAAGTTSEASLRKDGQLTINGSLISANQGAFGSVLTVGTGGGNATTFDVTGTGMNIYPGLSKVMIIGPNSSAAIPQTGCAWYGPTNATPNIMSCTNAGLASLVINAGGGATVNTISGTSSTMNNYIVTQGTITADAQGLSGTATWNSSGVTFTGVKWAFTDTASAAASKPLEIFTGSSGATSVFSVRKDGKVTSAAGFSADNLSSQFGTVVLTQATGQLVFSNRSTLQGSTTDGQMKMANNARTSGITYSFTSNGNLLLTDYNNVTGAGVTASTFAGTSATMGGYATAVNCSTSSCGSASSGSAVIAAGTTTVTISTTAITAVSQIQITEDTSLGAGLGVTCNTQTDAVLGTPHPTTRTAAASFVVAVDVAPTVNPKCFNWTLIN